MKTNYFIITEVDSSINNNLGVVSGKTNEEINAKILEAAKEHFDVEDVELLKEFKMHEFNYKPIEIDVCVNDGEECIYTLEVNNTWIY